MEDHACCLKEAWRTLGWKRKERKACESKHTLLLFKMSHFQAPLRKQSQVNCDLSSWQQLSTSHTEHFSRNSKCDFQGGWSLFSKDPNLFSHRVKCSDFSSTAPRLYLYFYLPSIQQVFWECKTHPLHLGLQMAFEPALSTNHTVSLVPCSRLEQTAWPARSKK